MLAPEFAFAGPSIALPRVLVFSIGHRAGQWGSATRVPAVTSGFGLDVIDVATRGPVWGWTPPGDLRAATRYSGQIIANLEYRPVVPARPAAGWNGDELADAAALAPHVAGVISHGFIPKPLERVFGLLASHGAVGFPEVFDPDRSTDPRSFTRTCVESWRRIGFKAVVPVFGAAAGVDFLRAGLDEAARLGLGAALWTSGSMGEQGITPADLGLQGDSMPPPSQPPQQPSGLELPQVLDWLRLVSPFPGVAERVLEAAQQVIAQRSPVGPSPWPSPAPGPWPPPAPGPFPSPAPGPWPPGPWAAPPAQRGGFGWLVVILGAAYLFSNRRDRDG